MHVCVYIHTYIYVYMQFAVYLKHCKSTIFNKRNEREEKNKCDTYVREELQEQ